MEESNDRSSSVLSSGINNKNSDSGYGSTSNKSNNSQSQRSSGSSKSHQSSLSSSGSCSFLSHPNINAPSADQHDQQSPGNQCFAGAPGKMEKRRKKKKVKSASSTDRGDMNQRLTSIDESKKLPPSFEKASAANQSLPFSSSDTSQEASPDSRFVPPADSKTLQMAALNHVLSCFKNVREQDLDMSDEDSEQASSSSVWNEKFEEMKDELNITPENCFGAVMSMTDGLVVHITEEITQILGYPTDMWMGRSFLDLVHPKDKISFANQFTNTGGVGLPWICQNAGSKGDNTGSPQQSEHYFCRLRQYRGLKSTGFGVSDKPVTFFPFRLTLKLKEIESVEKHKAKPSTETEGGAENMEKKPAIYLFIGAHRITSAYQYPEEAPVNPDKFTTRHSPSCQLGHIDPSAVTYLGHMPQDVMGHSVLDYYHPDDMLLLRDIYEGVMTERGKPFKSKPYRFRAYNGTFATLETDWSCFINPWSWKLEFVIGQHKVVKGPMNPNVFTPPKPPDPVREPSIEVKRIQEQIKQRLTETVSRRATDPLRVRISRRKKDLTQLLETLLDQIGGYDSSDRHSTDSVGSAFSVMERDSVMLGEISPHHDDHSGSNQSSETPPSYNQLNYRENIERFFLSQPKTTRESDESGDVAKNETDDLPLGSTEDEDSKGSPNGSSGSMNRQSGNDSGNNDNYENMITEDHDDKPCSLTEDTLYRHNENMEKSLIKRHRETRGKNTSLASSYKNSRLKLYDPGNKQTTLKRTGNLAGWVSSGSSRKAYKQPHMDATPKYPETFLVEPKMTNPALWPPYSVGSTEAVVTPNVTSYAPVVNPPGIMMPGLTSMPGSAATGLADARMQSIFNQQQSRPFMCFPSQPQQYMQAPGVSYALPGSANIIYQQLGTSTIYGQQPNIYAPTQQHMMAPGGTPLVGPAMYNHPDRLLPTVPGAMQTLNVAAPILRPNVRIVQPGGYGPMPTNPLVLAGPGMSMIRNRPVSMTTQQSVSSAYPISTNTTSNISSLDISKPTPAVPMRPTPADKTKNRTDDSSSSSPELSKLKPIPKRLTVVKASADFSSSDGFGDSSSSSMFSLLKTGQSSDESFSPDGGSREDKTSYDSPDRFQSHGSDGDQDMLWENHVDKSQFEDLQSRAKLMKKPPWLQNINMTQALSMRYQLPDNDLSEILQRDLHKLQIIGNQPILVNEQLETLYSELQNDGSTPSLNLDEGSSRYSSFSSCYDDDQDDHEDETRGMEKVPDKREISRADYEKIVQVYEENAPFPKRKFGM